MMPEMLLTKLANPAFTNGKQSGQATKGAAAMLLAEVYMEQKKYAENRNIA